MQNVKNVSIDQVRLPSQPCAHCTCAVRNRQADALHVTSWSVVITCSSRTGTWCWGSLLTKRLLWLDHTHSTALKAPVSWPLRAPEQQGAPGMCAPQSLQNPVLTQHGGVIVATHWMSYGVEAACTKGEVKNF